MGIYSRHTWLAFILLFDRKVISFVCTSMKFRRTHMASHHKRILIGVVCCLTSVWIYSLVKILSFSSTGEEEEFYFRMDVHSNKSTSNVFPKSKLRIRQKIPLNTSEVSNVQKYSSKRARREIDHIILKKFVKQEYKQHLHLDRIVKKKNFSLRARSICHFCYRCICF